MDQGTKKVNMSTYSLYDCNNNVLCIHNTLQIADSYCHPPPNVWCCLGKHAWFIHIEWMEMAKKKEKVAMIIMIIIISFGTCIILNYIYSTSNLIMLVIMTMTMMMVMMMMTLLPQPIHHTPQQPPPPPPPPPQWENTKNPSPYLYGSGMMWHCGSFKKLSGRTEDRQTIV